MKTRCLLIPAMVAGLALGGGSAPASPSPSPSQPAYFVAEYKVTDAAGMKPYREGVEATFKPFGGHFMVRGGSTVALEGAPVNGGIVVIAFASMAKAQAWYHSPAYSALRPIRQRSAITRVYIVEGAPQ
jgi:uncharacterized protein (DUF1330 family)